MSRRSRRRRLELAVKLKRVIARTGDSLVRHLRGEDEPVKAVREYFVQADLMEESPVRVMDDELDETLDEIFNVY